MSRPKGKHLLLRHKIPGALVGAAVVSAILLGGFAYSTASSRRFRCKVCWREEIR